MIIIIPTEFTTTAKKITVCFAILTSLAWGINTVHAKPTSSKSTVKTNSSSSKEKSDDDAKSEKDDDKSSSDSKSSNPDSDETEDKSEKVQAEPKPAETPSILTIESLPTKLTGILASASQSSDWGVKIMVAETGQTLFEMKSENGFIPASNRKLFTGALALDQLGPDFTFKTYLYYTGNIDSQGTLNGNLVIIPSGDPTFSSVLYRGASSDWVFKDWAKKVQAAGIRRISGDLLIDCSAWDMGDLNPQGWASRVLNDSYAPQTSPLTINENVCNIIVSPTKAGQSAAVSFTPPATGYLVNNSAITGKSSSVSVIRSVGSMNVKGSVASQKTIYSRPIDKPTLFAAANFRHHLTQTSIPITKGIRILTTGGIIPPRTNTNTLAMVQSPPLTDIISYMMKKSDNHMAEQIYVSVSAAKLGKGSYTNSRRLEADLLSRARIDPASVHCYDGSGLSESNRVTPSQVCNLLTYMRGHKFSQQYYDSMAIAGRDGTLRNRMGTIAGKVHAKTGTINGVKTLSGYLSLSPTQTISFSFLVNRIKTGSVSSTQDRLCSTLASLVL